MAIETDAVLVELTPVEDDVDVMSDEDLELLAEAEAEKKRQKEELLESLANAVEAKFTTRQARRTNKEAQWLRSAHLYYGKLSLPDYYTKGETPWERGLYSQRPDVNIVRSKCSIAIAQSVSMQFGTSNKNWDLWPAPNDDTPECAAACELMSDEIQAQLEASKYVFQCRKAMWDRVVIGTGVLKGPLSTGKLTRSYEKMEGSNVWQPTVSVDYAPIVTHVNPWFFYPDETVEDVKSLQDTVEIHPMSALELKKLMKHDGFFAIEIEQVLEERPSEYQSKAWSDYAALTSDNAQLFKDKYLVLEYHGPITRTQLDKMEIEPTYDSLNDEYYGEVWVCQGRVIRLELEAIEASFCVPYYIAVWEKDPTSVFGYGVPLMMEDAQRVVNESWHMILDNSSISSGPQAAMQKSLIEPANGKWEFGPGQIWYLTDMQARVDQAIQFFNVPNVTQQLIPIMQLAQGFAEEESGIPLITAGLTSPEVVNTATGSAMIQQASTTLLDFMSEDWDDNITSPLIEAWYGWNMQFSKKDEIKGAYSVDVRTSNQYKNKQLHIRDLEKLSVEAAQNPAMAMWINQPALQKARIDMMEIPSDSIVKTPEQVQQEQEAAAANAEPNPEMLTLQLKARQLSLEEKKLAFESGQQQVREKWEHEEKMTANQARLVESQARVAVSQNEKETEILKLMQKSEADAMKIMSNEKINRENNQTTAFLKGLEETRKQQETDLYGEELEIKKDMGSGV